MADRNRVEKYTLIDSKTKEVTFKSPSELNKLLSCRDDIIGIHRHGDGSVRPSNFFKPIPCIGDENEESAYTVINKCITEKDCHYEISDGVGKTKIVSKSEIISMIQDGMQVNGLRLRDTSLLVNKQIDIVIRKEE